MKKIALTRLQFLTLLYLQNVKPAVFDEAIDLFDSALVKTGLMKNYGHCNPSSLKFKDRDWLTALSKRWDSLEWMHYMNWLDLVLMDVSKDDEGLEAMLPYERS